MTGEDLGYKLRVVEQAKFEYSPLGKVFDIGLEKEDKKERLLKRLKNVEVINKKQFEKQLKPIENDITNHNANAFRKIRFLNKLITVAKENLMKLKS